MLFSCKNRYGSLHRSQLADLTQPGVSVTLGQVQPASSGRVKAAQGLAFIAPYREVEDFRQRKLVTGSLFVPTASDKAAVKQ